MPRYRNSSAYNQLLIAHIKSIILFMKYLPPVRPKMFPKLKTLRIYWNLAQVIFRISQLDFGVKNYFYWILTTCPAQIGPKIKSVQNLLKFGTFDISNMAISILMSKMIFIKYLLPVRPELIFDTFDISNILTSILMSKNIFYQIFTNF